MLEVCPPPCLWLVPKLRAHDVRRIASYGPIRTRLTADGSTCVRRPLVRPSACKAPVPDRTRGFESLLPHRRERLYREVRAVTSQEVTCPCSRLPCVVLVVTRLSSKEDSPVRFRPLGQVRKQRPGERDHSGWAVSLRSAHFTIASASVAQRKRIALPRRGSRVRISFDAQDAARRSAVHAPIAAIRDDRLRATSIQCSGGFQAQVPFLTHDQPLDAPG